MERNRYRALAAEFENASIYIWRKDKGWIGMVVFRTEPSMIQFAADGEATAKAEALRIASKSNAEWKSVVSLAPW